MAWGVCITSLDVLIVLAMQGRGFRFLEILVVGLIATMGGCFAVEIFYSHAGLARAWRSGFCRTLAIVKDRHMLYVALGILGATVMPHNLYLHSSIVQTRRYALTSAGKRDAIRFANIDSAFALMFALGVNAAILIVAAATFYRSGHHERGGYFRRLQIAHAAAGGFRGGHYLRHRAARLRAKLDADRDAGGADRDGGFSAFPHPAVAAAASSRG